MGRCIAFVALLVGGCSEYQLSDQEQPQPAVPADTAPDADTGTPVVTTPDPIDTSLPEPTCADQELPEIAWSGSATFDQAPDPVDASGTPFYELAADLSGWASVVLPNRDIPIGDDRAYVGVFELEELPVNLSLNLQSDDGIVVWVNGTWVGQWGGAWQLEGCVNENAQCLVTTEVDPVDVTDLLQVGRNVVAARVSNPVQSAYFEILPECVD